MKIGLLTNNIDSKNGWGRYSLELIEGMRSRGHEIIILKEIDDGFEGHVVLKKGWKIFSIISKVKNILSDCDVIQAIDGYPNSIIAYLAAKKIRKPLIISLIGTYSVAPLSKFFIGFLLKKSYKAADKIISISSYTKKGVLKHIPDLDAKVINPGIDLNKFHHRLPANKKFMLGVGALKERKGYQYSLEAFALLANQFPDLDYYIVGDDNSGYARKMKNFAKDNGLENRVRFFSKISDEKLAELYSTAQLFVLTPINDNERFEGFGLVFLEAAASGLPVIGTLGNGSEDAILDGKNGFLVPQCDSKSTAEAIKKILDSNLGSKMSLESYNWAKQNDLNHSLDKYESIYKHLLSLD